MAISKSSKRVQFTLNTRKEKENQIAEFLDGCIEPNSTIKEIIYDYIVSNSGVKSPQVTQITQIKNTQSEEKPLKVTHFEEKPPEMDEIQLNEMEELSKFTGK